jgi:hypothetical protein
LKFIKNPIMTTPIFYIIEGGDYIFDYIYSIEKDKLIKGGDSVLYQFQMPREEAIKLLNHLNETRDFGLFLRLMSTEYIK